MDTCTPIRVMSIVTPPKPDPLTIRHQPPVVIKEQPNQWTFYQILSEFKEKNSFSFVDELAHTIKQQYDAVLLAQTLSSSLYRRWSRFFNSLRKTPISKWSSDEINQWAEYINKTKKVYLLSEYLPEVIAVIIRAMELTMGYKPNGVQMIALLAMLNNTNPKDGY
uniref:Uncharacterized protein n=1 Tax=Ditylenchus dipsaci TaxID=166011 RepID=A0A915D4J7_9BILA